MREKSHVRFLEERAAATPLAYHRSPSLVPVPESPEAGDSSPEPRCPESIAGYWDQVTRTLPPGTGEKKPETEEL